MASDKTIVIKAFERLNQYDDYWSQNDAHHKIAAAFLHCATMPGIGWIAVRVMCWAARAKLNRVGGGGERNDVIALLELIPDPNPVPDLNMRVYD